MRGLSGREQVERFMRALGQAVRQPTRVYLTGGASAVLLGWRETTIDVDLSFVPETDGVFQAIARLKEELGINVELVAPSHFIPPLPGWGNAQRLYQSGGAGLVLSLRLLFAGPRENRARPRAGRARCGRDADLRRDRAGPPAGPV